MATTLIYARGYEPPTAYLWHFAPQNKIILSYETVKIGLVLAEVIWFIAHRDIEEWSYNT